MGNFVEMADFVNENAVDFNVTLPGTRNSYDDNGRLQKGEDDGPKPWRGVILPFSYDEMQKVDNGRYTEKDRKVYTTAPLVKGAIVDYGGERYEIDREISQAEYTDVYRYYAKGKGAGFA